MIKTKHVYISGIIFIIICSSASAWLSGYEHRSLIEINNTGENLTHYQYNFTLNTQSLILANKMNFNGNDTRITDNNDNLLPWWNETSFNITSTKIWVNATSLNNITNTTHYIYYGNATASSVFNGNTTFLFFDDFPGNSLNTTSKWTVNTGSPVVSGGLLTVGTANMKLYTQQGFGVNTSLRGKFNIITEGNYLLWGVGDMTTWNNVCWNRAGALDETATRLGGSEGSQNYGHGTGWMVNDIHRIATSSVKFYKDGNIQNTHTTQLPTANINAFFATDGGGHIQSDWVFIRKHVEPEPSVNISVNGIITISSPTPEVNDIKYVGNRTVTYSATPSLMANCKWSYLNDTLIEWDNSTISPSMKRWINSSSITTLNISLIAYETGNSSNFAVETWNNSIVDNVFDSNWTWNRIRYVDYEILRGAQLVCGDVFNQDDDREECVFARPTGASFFIQELDGSYRDVSRTSPVSQKDVSLWDVDQDGKVEFISTHASRLISLWRFNSTGTVASNLDNSASSVSNNNHGIGWLMVGGHWFLYQAFCGGGEVVWGNISATGFSSGHIYTVPNSGEDSIVFDIDHDGVDELVISGGYSAGTATVYILEINNVTGEEISVTPILTQSLNEATHYAVYITKGDVDNDGIENLIVGWKPSGTDDTTAILEAYEYNTSYASGYEEAFVIDDIGADLQYFAHPSQHIVTTDINGDGDNEVYLGTMSYSLTGSEKDNFLYCYNIGVGGGFVSKTTIANFTNYFGVCSVTGYKQGVWVAPVNDNNVKKLMVATSSECTGDEFGDIFILESKIVLFTPPDPVTLQNTTGNFWINHTWQPGSGNVTDSYNVSVNDIWYNTTTNNTYYNDTYSSHARQNITIYAFNSTNPVSLSLSSISQNTQIPNNPVTITNLEDWDVENESIISVDCDSIDIDSDIPVFSCNRTDLFTDFNTATGMGGWTTNTNGTFIVDFGVSDEYRSTDNYTMKIIVSMPVTPDRTIYFNNLYENISIWNMLSAIFRTYEIICGGSLFWLIIILIPFTMTWIKQQSIIIPSILALICGSTLFVLIPYTAGSSVMILLSIGVMGILYHILKKE